MIHIDTKTGCIQIEDDGQVRTVGIGTPEGFRLLSKLWLRSGWDTKYVYGFSWLGRPMIQLPEDVLRIQEVVFSVQPDIIIETGVAHGGSLVFYASLCKAMGRGRVVGIDIEIRPHNRKAIEDHFLAPWITLVEGSSVDPVVTAHVKSLVKPEDKVVVMLDSCHSRDHVLAELGAYAPLVTGGSYIVAMDGIMEEVAGAPRTQADWTWNNPKTAVAEFLKNHPEFALVEPSFLFNEGAITERVTYWPGAFLQRRP